MTRYTINIGDDFPLGEEPAAAGGPANGPAGGPGGHRIEHGPPRFRGRALLRVLFVVALVAVVIHHPFPVLLLTGLVLLVRRRHWSIDRHRFDALRDRVQSQIWNSPILQGGAGPFACSRPDCGRSWKREQPKRRDGGEGGGGYGAFV